MKIIFAAVAGVALTGLLVTGCGGSGRSGGSKTSGALPTVHGTIVATALGIAGDPVSNCTLNLPDTSSQIVLKVSGVPVVIADLSSAAPYQSVFSGGTGEVCSEAFTFHGVPRGGTGLYGITVSDLSSGFGCQETSYYKQAQLSRLVKIVCMQ
jgi:hypothetical protein